MNFLELMVVKRTLLFLILYFLPFLFSAQDNLSGWEAILASDLTINQKQNKLDTIITQHQNQGNDTLLERITHKYAIWKYKIRKLGDAIKTAQYSLELKKKLYPTDITLLQHGLKNLAFFYFKNKAYTKSIALYEELLTINPNNHHAPDAYSGLGRCYSKIGDYYKAAMHFDLARSLFLEKKAYKSLITNSINAASIDIKLETLESYSKGIKNLKFADSLAQLTNSRASTRYNIKILLGTLHNQEKNLNPKRALHYYQQALDIARKLEDSTRIAKTFEIIGNLYNTLDPDLGMQYHQKAIQYSHTNDTVQLAISFSNIGYCLEQKGLYEDAITNYHKAIGLFTGKSLPELSKIEWEDPTLHTSYVLIILRDLANTYLKQFKTTGNKTSLHQSLQTFLMADRLIDIIRIESKEFQSKLYWRKQSAEVYGNAVEACFLAQDIEHAFYFMEKNKALLLTEDLINHKLRQSLKLPKDITDKETIVRKKIYLLETKKAATTDPKELDALSIEVLHQKRYLYQLQDSIHNAFDTYVQVDIRSPIPNIQSVQKSLDENTIVFEYNISEHETYGFTTDKEYTPLLEGSRYGRKTFHKAYVLCITKNDLHFIEVQQANQLKKDVIVLMHKVATPFKTQKDILSYQNIGYRVFDQLFPKEHLKNSLKDKKLIIIPDHYLNYLPFEALVTSSNSDKKMRYLIEDSEISYGYSHAFLKNSSSPGSETKHISFLGFAPGNFEKYDLAPLENKQEVSDILHYFPGEIVADTDATKERFLSIQKNHPIIHLATHADAVDAISPWIAFSDSKLQLEELYLTKNKSELVVLSGCNTLQGRQETGEGVMSLARGFFYSGTKSVVSSLWNADDRSTRYIMQQFYKNLKDKQSKSEALREAKLDYLNNHNLSEGSPHFWATFVLLGDPSALQTSSRLSKYWWLLLLSILLVVVIAYRTHQKN